MKICLVCFDFIKENLRKQPWVYIYDICLFLHSRGIDFFVVSNASTGTIQNVRVVQIESLYTFLSDSHEVTAILEKEKPDLVIELLGITSFLRTKKWPEIPVIGVLTSPRYTFREVSGIGWSEFFRHFNYVFIHLAGSLIPDSIIRKRSRYYSKIVLLSETNKLRIEKTGTKTELIVIAPKIDDVFFEPVNKNTLAKIKSNLSPTNVPLILYFTSPLTLRGTDTLLHAFNIVRKNIPCKLVFLFRIDRKTENDLKRLKSISDHYRMIDSVEFITLNMEPREIRQYLSAADVVCLPFKLVFSDAPLSVLEASAVGIPVITTYTTNNSNFIIGNGGLFSRVNTDVILANYLINELKKINFEPRSPLKTRIYSDEFCRAFDYRMMDLFKITEK